MLGNHERSTYEEEIGSESAGLRNGLEVISRAHGNHFGHVILLVLHPSHFGYFDFDSELQTKVAVEEGFHHQHRRSMEVPDYSSSQQQCLKFGLLGRPGPRGPLSTLTAAEI
jgi:hypothetical protein